tara:strand:- start:93 stop:386 length:294 start_codon:yes stop_codon:yes gene_type:complete
MKKLIKWLLKPFRKLKRRWILAKAYPKLKKAYQNQLVERKKLRANVNIWLREYFGIDANSKYIPKDFKNKEEVQQALEVKFGDEMQRLNLTYTDLFK